MANYTIQDAIRLFDSWNGYLEKYKNGGVGDMTPAGKIRNAGSDNETIYAVWYQKDTGINLQNQPYCAMALSSAFSQSYGLALAKKLFRGDLFHYCPTGYNQFYKAGAIVTTPQVGDLVFFWSTSLNRWGHIGLIREVRGNYIYTNEANTSSKPGVERNGGATRSGSDQKSYLIGSVKMAFGRPDWKLLGSTFTEGWKEESDGWKYQLSDGSFIKNQWKYIKDKWYVFNGDGIMQTGWIYSNEQWYYTNQDGAMEAGWVLKNEKWYYLNGTGEMHTGWLQDKTDWYYLTNDGSMQKGWGQINNEKYVFDDSGRMIVNTWFYEQATKNWFYLSSSGAAYKSAWKQQEDGKWYYLTESYNMAKNAWIRDKYEEIYYFVDNDGVYVADKDSPKPDKNYPVVI